MGKVLVVPRQPRDDAISESGVVASGRASRHGIGMRGVCRTVVVSLLGDPVPMPNGCRHRIS
jgi:hypothetical protein